MKNPQQRHESYTVSPWLIRVMRLLALGFLLFFGTGMIVILFYNQSLLNSEGGRLAMSLVRWGNPGGGGEHYELMICVIYIVWGAFLWRAAANPLRHKLFMDFTVVANTAHFGLMFIQGLLMHGEHIHLVGDILLGWAGLLLLILFWLPARAHAN